MNKTEYAKAIVAQVNEMREANTEEGKSVKRVTLKDIKEILDVARDIAYTAMAEEDEVTVFDGLKLVGVHKEATTARNPKDGSTIDVPEKVVPKAKFGAVAKRIVNGEE